MADFIGRDARHCFCYKLQKVLFLCFTASFVVFQAILLVYLLELPLLCSAFKRTKVCLQAAYPAGMPSRGNFFTLFNTKNRTKV